MKIAYIASYPPRECGIATFTHNLVKSVSLHQPKKIGTAPAMIVAINDFDNQYEYPEEVQFVIRQDHQKDYARAANFINYSDAQVCILQHEFGLFGGESGVYILPLLHRLQIPLIVTFHTVLKEPSFIQKVVMQEIAHKAARVVVMSHRAVEFLKNIYQIPSEKIALIEHGVPDFPVQSLSLKKELFHFQDRKVLLTFGLLSRNKGLETVIKALPAVVARHPDILYVILGNTHPAVLRHSGEEYRDSLKRMVSQLKLDKHVLFINRFVNEELVFQYLSACDLYITPYLNEAQITSGTLSYAIGAGAAVISTPYWHAQELLSDGRGRLFDFKDSEQLSSIINELLDNPPLLQAMQQKALHYGQHLKWPRIGKQYYQLAQRVIAEMPAMPPPDTQGIVDLEILPKFSLLHVQRLTDDTGIVQHAKYGIPNLKEGYCLDDNARALMMVLMAYQQNKSKEALELLPIYLSYIHYMQLPDGNFRNFLSFERAYLDEVGSEDSFGRTVWALGYLIRYAPNNSYREFGFELFQHSVQHFYSLQHLRGAANTVIGIAHFLKQYPADERMMKILHNLVSKLVNAYHQHRIAGEWHWFEEKMTYDNGILPLALFHAAEIMNEENIRHIAVESLQFLEKITLRNGYFTPIGNLGWYQKGGSIPLYDQQAIETMAMVLLYQQAFVVEKNPAYLEKMSTCYLWFLGENELRIPLFDHETHGCCDGLQQYGLNRNQGAESTLAYLISHLTVLKAVETQYLYQKKPAYTSSVA